MRIAQRQDPARRHRHRRRAAWGTALGAALLLGLLASRAAADEELDYGLEANRLHQIRLTGNTTYEDKELKRVLRFQRSDWRRFLDVPTYKPHMVQTQLRVLRSFYRNRGFHQAEVGLDSVTTEPEKGDILHISVVEGPRTVIRQVDFVGSGALSPERLREVLVLVEGEPAPMDLNAFGGDIYAIRDLYRSASFLRTRVEPAMTIVPDTLGTGYFADMLYTIDPGEAYRVGSIIYSGNENTKEQLLRRELLISAGEPLYWQRVVESRRQLLATALFRDVSIVPVDVDTTSGVADLVVHVVERRPGFYELGVGVGSLELIRLLAAWGHNNLWGSGHRLRVSARASWNVEDVVGNPIEIDEGQLNYRGEVTYVNPRFYDSRYSLETSVYLQRETRGESGINMQKVGARLGTSWRASRVVGHNVHLGLRSTRPSAHPYAPDSLKARIEETGTEVTQVRSINWAIFVDHRDERFAPTDGTYMIGTLALAGPVLGGDYTFFKWSAALHSYHATFLGGVLAGRVMLGGARPFGKSLDQGPEGVPYEDRFFAGGASSVRGYRHNSLGPQVVTDDERNQIIYNTGVLLPDFPARGGNYLMLTNAEWRVPLPGLRRWGFAGVLFFEGGNVWAQLKNIRAESFRLTSIPGDPDDPASTKSWDYRWSWGTGIRFQTPFGPVRVDVGFPLKRVKYVSPERNEVDPSPYWHFSLGYPF